MDIHDGLSKCHPKLARGVVWCKKCGISTKVDSGSCLKEGWPKCCGETMTIDSPDERAQLAKVKNWHILCQYQWKDALNMG